MTPEQQARDALRAYWEAARDARSCLEMMDIVEAADPAAADYDWHYEDWCEAVRVRDDLYDEFDRIIRENGLDADAIARSVRASKRP